MSVEIAGEIVGLEEANAELDRMIAAEQSTPETRSQGAEGGGQKPEGGQADEAGKGASTAAQGDQTAQAKADNADSEKSKGAAEEQRGKGAEEKAADKAGDDSKPKSRYAKAQERLQGGWEELNTSKAAIKAEQDAWQKQRDAEKAELQRQREEFDRERSQAEGKFTPDQYEAAAKKFEADGKLDLADLARTKAEELRRNPPAKAGDRQEAARKEWALRAGKDFPELAKDNSPLQMRVAQLLNEEAEFKAHPKGIYVAARIANLEAQAAQSKTLKETVAARDKELSALKAKITELEGLTAPGGGNGVTRLPAGKPFEQMSGEEQLAELERDARELGALGR